MRRLLEHTVRVPYAARTAEPYTADEIDALPEPYRARVWATILALREYVSPERPDHHEKGF